MQTLVAIAITIIWLTSRACPVVLLWRTHPSPGPPWLTCTWYRASGDATQDEVQYAPLTSCPIAVTEQLHMGLYSTDVLCDQFRVVALNTCSYADCNTQLGYNKIFMQA